MKSITIRNIDDNLDRALRRERLKTKKSFNTIILETLKSVLIPAYFKKKGQYDDLDALAGTWTEKDELDFDENTAAFEKIDEALWK